MVIDPTSAQFGWREIVAPWQSYEKHRIYKVNMTKVLSPRMLGCCIIDEHFNDRQTAADRMLEILANGLNKQLERRSKPGILALLQLSNHDFALSRDAFVTASNRGISHLVQEINQKARPTSLYPLGFKIKGPLDLPVARKLVDAFHVTEEEIKKAEPKLMTRTELQMASARWNKIIELGDMPGFSK
ncbi:MAG: hypothetical protein JWP44_4453 [Mucilaginibacter sp.]|jgi:hypothetical protein|nr:hypothetical protein [Mucilaginibacter sp.]